MNDFISFLVAFAQTLPWPLMTEVYFYNFFAEAKHYLLVALVVWLVLHRLLKSRLKHRLIAAWPTSQDIRREMAYSLLSMLVFAGLSMVLVAGLFNGHVVIYSQPDAYGWVWLVLSFPALLIWQDVYFYATHRLLHTPWLFKRIHSVHHRSRHPSPWAAYSFHPIEALINGLVMPLALFVVPVHGAVLVASILHQIFRNTLGHAAIETMPAGFTRHPLGRLFTTTTHHHLHHETGRGNYGLWFSWWDRWMGTERIDYLGRFDSVTQKPEPCSEEIAVPKIVRSDRQWHHAPADH